MDFYFPRLLDLVTLILIKMKLLQIPTNLRYPPQRLFPCTHLKTIP